MIEIDKTICGDLAEAGSREWLETNGIGGYATGTVAGAHTRRYHGLLVAATKPPLGRAVLLSKLEETLIVDDERFDLSCNRFPGAIHPEGYKFLTGFRLDPFPIWTFSIKGIELEKAVFMVYGENTVVSAWKLTDNAAAACSLEVRPLLAFRDHHHLRHEDANFTTAYQDNAGVLSFSPYAEMPALYLAHNAAKVAETGNWYRNFEYAIEQERGFEYTEDLYQPCSLAFDLAEEAVIIASTERKDVSAATLRSAEVERRIDIVVASDAKTDLGAQLALAADQFLVKRGDGETVIAGYPWFADWGRDTMIALPGLTLATGRYEAARGILVKMAEYISEGMIPNRFPEDGETPDYNTADATLWFFEAVRAYISATGDDGLSGEMYDHFVQIIEWHVRGTRYGIRVDTDGLLHTGEAGTQLTWMDAKIGDRVITPRIGKPVEIQALWYNALCITADMAERHGDAGKALKFSDMAAIASESFNGQFWYEQGGYLFDVIGDGGKDASFRPNQIFAVSLPYSMLDNTRSREVVKAVERELLTPFGLRTLAVSDQSYVGTYIGSPEERDASYHQGTVWAWLLGPFIDAFRKVHSRDAKADGQLDEMLKGLTEHLKDKMLGHVSEIFDGDAPHAPRGCPAQAWSIAELIRSLAERQR